MQSRSDDGEASPVSVPSVESWPAATARAKVWVIDDSPLQAEACRRALVHQYDVKTYDGGGQMLEDLAQGSPPDVLVLDWHMPDLSGIEVCHFVRRTRNLAELPILILTAAGSTDSLLEALAAGANDFVKKPFSEPELNARVATLTRMSALHSRLAEVEGRLRLEAEFRERFMGMLAHDLRQPLNAISMAAQTALAAPAEKSASLLNMQKRAIDRMSRMIAELLDFTRVRPESGMPIQREFTDFAEIVRISAEEIRLANQRHAVNVNVHGSCTGYWDPDRLAQVCSNLICNAIEHSAPESPIEVDLTADQELVSMRVSNAGAAIPEDLLSTLFQPFRRGRSQRRAKDGLGLGLHIVDQIVRAHGGTLRVESDTSGTHFIVALPLGTPRAS